MWTWIIKMGDGIKSTFTLISRVMKLEGRVTVIEEKIKALELPPKDLKDGLDYIKNIHLYQDKATGENFCPTCLGKDNKRVAIQIRTSGSEQYWNCAACNSYGTNRTNTSVSNLPRYSTDEELY